ncbi:MAG: hypothetical protein WCC52_07195 [Nitrosotalea sp.]
MRNCGIHEYSTESDEEWQRHMESEIHTHNTTECDQCGKQGQYSYTGKLIGNKVPALCPDCELAIKNTVQNM